MSDPQDDPAHRAAQAERLLAAWETPRSWRYWSAVNNTEVGRWYVAASMAFFLFAGGLALVMRSQLARPDQQLVSADLYNQLFTLHGSVMMFLFAVPIFEAAAMLLMPQMLGSRDLPFPRLSAYGFWCFVIGGVFVSGSILFNAAPVGGWFMYPPLTTRFQEGIGNDIWLLGLSFIEVAALATAVELIVGVLKCRPPGMRINLIPIYAWYVLVVAGMILFAFPPLIAGDLLFELERMAGWPFFNPARGGDPLLWQHLFWIFGHPEVYVIFLPAVALVAMMVPTFAGVPLMGYSFVVLAAVGTGFISFGLWVHHMYTTGLPALSLGFFSAASVAVAIPTGVQIFCFIATALTGRPRRSVPMLFIAGGLAIFVLGGLTGVMVAIAPFDFQAHDSYFVVAHLHYVLVGGAVFPVIAGFYYYYPVANDRALSERLGRVAFWLMFIGFNLAFFPMHLPGLAGMPRRVFTYGGDLGLDLFNLLATVGAFILAAGVAVFAFDVVRPKGREPCPPRNLWGAGTLEWMAEVPGQPWGARCVPRVSSRYPLWDQKDFLKDLDEGRFYLPDAEEGKRETLVTSVIDARPVQCLRVPGNSWMPLWAALFTGGLFIFTTFHLWWLAAASGLLMIAAVLLWLWRGSAVIPEKPAKPVGLGLTLPLYLAGPDSVGWWAMFITLVGDATAFLSLLFGYFYYWTARPDFPLPATPVGSGWLLAALGLLLAAWALTWAALAANRRDRRTALYALLGGAALLGLAGAGALLAGPWTAGLDPTSHVYPATVWVLAIWTALHAAAGVLMQLYCLARSAARRLTAEHAIDLWNVTLYWHFLAATALATVAVLAGFPRVVG